MANKLELVGCGKNDTVKIPIERTIEIREELRNITCIRTVGDFSNKAVWLSRYCTHGEIKDWVVGIDNAGEFIAVPLI